MRYLSVVWVLLLTLAVGCGQIVEGRRINDAMTKNILAPGTDENKIVEMFGQPQQKENLGNGENKYIYYYRTRRPLLFFNHANANPNDLQRLEIFLKGNEVQQYRYVSAEQVPITTDVGPILPERK